MKTLRDIIFFETKRIVKHNWKQGEKEYATLYFDIKSPTLEIIAENLKVRHHRLKKYRLDKINEVLFERYGFTDRVFVKASFFRWYPKEFTNDGVRKLREQLYLSKNFKVTYGEGRIISDMHHIMRGRYGGLSGFYFDVHIHHNFWEMYVKSQGTVSPSELDGIVGNFRELAGLL